MVRSRCPMHLTPLQLALALAVVAVTHFLGALAAYGSTLLALPPLTGVLGDLRLCVGLLRVTGTLQGAQVAAYTWRETDWREYRRMVLWAGLGMAPGLAAAELLPRTPLLVALALIVLVFGTLGLARSNGDRSPLPNAVGIALLLASGLIHGAFACGGATLVLYAQHSIGRKETFRSTLSLFWVTVNLPAIVAWLCTGGWTLRVAWLLAWFAPTALLASWAGEWAARRVSQRAFARVVSGLLLASGAILLAKALTGS